MKNTHQSVQGVVFSKNRKKVLLVKRRDVPVYVLPGGGVDENETFENAIIREIFEESGFKVEIKKKVGEYIPVNKLARYTHVYECDVLSGEATISDESKEVIFFNIDTIPKMPPPYKEWILDALENKNELITKKLTSITYFALIKNLFLHPIIVIRFLLTKIGLTINT